jgi:hypothetical protein
LWVDHGTPFKLPGTDLQVLRLLLLLFPFKLVLQGSNAHPVVHHIPLLDARLYVGMDRGPTPVASEGNIGTYRAGAAEGPAGVLASLPGHAAAAAAPLSVPNALEEAAARMGKPALGTLPCTVQLLLLLQASSLRRVSCRWISGSGHRHLASAVLRATYK